MGIQRDDVAGDGEFSFDSFDTGFPLAFAFEFVAFGDTILLFDSLFKDSFFERKLPLVVDTAGLFSFFQAFTKLNLITIRN